MTSTITPTTAMFAVAFTLCCTLSQDITQAYILWLASFVCIMNISILGSTNDHKKPGDVYIECAKQSLILGAHLFIGLIALITVVAVTR
jgi:hypothetical protein